MADGNQMMNEALKRRRQGLDVHKMLGHGHVLHAKGGMPGGEHGAGAIASHGQPSASGAMAKTGDEMHDERPDEADDLAPDVKDGGDSDLREKSEMNKEENVGSVHDDGGSADDKMGDDKDKSMAHPMQAMAAMLTPEGGKNSLRSKAHAHWMKSMPKSGS